MARPKNVSFPEFNEEFWRRFWNRVDKKNYGECWQWTFRQNSKGYAFIAFKGKEYLIHRVSYHYYNKGFDVELQINHTCDNRLCVNPKHLYAGTAKQNTKDATNKNRLGKINLDIANTIRQDRINNNISQRGLAKKYSLSKSTIVSILNEVSWNENREILPINVNKTSDGNYSVRMFINGKQESFGTYKTVDEAKQVAIQKRIEFPAKI